MNIRKAAGSDSEKINNLYKKLYSSNEPEVDFTEKDLKTKFISLLAEEDEKIIGFITATITWYVNANKNEAQLWDLYVDEDYRNKGIGSKLVKELEDIGREYGVDHIIVSINPDEDEENPTTFYKKNGYQAMKHPWMVKKLFETAENQ
jgi:ribosomal protein S18 acetylase RimI-like enzyme